MRLPVIREEADFARAAEEIGAALRQLHNLGGIEDVFRRLPAEGQHRHEAPAPDVSLRIRVQLAQRHGLDVEFSSQG